MVSKQAFQAQARENLVCDGQLFKKLAAGALSWLDANHQHVNELNVFPVPDGDTGTNMLHTMQDAYKRIENMTETDVGKVAAALAEGALFGARGNSGTILSQLWLGLAQTLKNQPTFDARLFDQAAQNAVKMAYKAVTNPTEGTILTVARESMEAVKQRVEDDQETDLVAVLKTMVYGARASLRRTPELLPVLKQARVVDSGGQGLVYILEGMLQSLIGKSLPAPLTLVKPGELPQLSDQDEADWQKALEPEDEEGYGYDVQFRMHGSNLDVDAIRQAIDDIGWSTVVVGNDKLIKVHVHVHDPGKPLSYAIGLGVELDDLVVENMQMQYHEYVQERMQREADAEANQPNIAIITVASGNGLRRLFINDLHAAYVISGGQTMNPSTGDFLDAINRVEADKIILLPNNKNIVLTAQQAAKMTENKQVRVIPTRTIPQGISAMLAYANLMDSEDLEEVSDEMTAGSKQVISAEVTTATRTVEIGGVSVREGQLIGLLEGSLTIAGSDLQQVLHDLLVQAKADEHELITLYYGNDTHKAKANAMVETLMADFPEQTFEVVYGGQALYPFIISIE